LIGGIKMNAKEKMKFLKKHADELEQSIYYAETILIPRVANDKLLLAKIKQDLIRAEAELKIVVAEEKKEENVEPKPA
jgi:hypothetical protein